MHHNALLELHIRNKVTTTFDTLRQEDIACRSNSNNMGVFTERLERDGVMDLARGFARVVEGNQVRGLKGLLGNGVDVVVLPTSYPLACETEIRCQRYALEPRYDTD